MGIFSLSDIIISITLFLNGCAILNFKFTDTVLPLEGQQISRPTGIKGFLNDLKPLRILIAIWNIFVLLLMLIFFK